MTKILSFLRKYVSKPKQMTNYEKAPTPAETGTAGPITESTPVNELPSCLDCLTVMKVVREFNSPNKMGVPIRYMYITCPKCAKKAMLMFRADKLNKLVIDTYWMNPSRKELDGLTYEL